MQKSPQWHPNKIHWKERIFSTLYKTIKQFYKESKNFFISDTWLILPRKHTSVID